MFPQRNRIVARMSKVTIVIEAAEKSGSLITADLALKFGKKLFAVPGPITSKVCVGTNNLIKEGQAQMLTSANDILEALELRRLKVEGRKNGGSRSTLYKLLSIEALTMDEMAMKLKKSVGEVSVELSMLQLRGEVTERDGKFYVT